MKRVDLIRHLERYRCELLREGKNQPEGKVRSRAETVHVVLDSELLRAADRVARSANRNRSALIRDALREYLKSLEILEREERDREGYAALPQLQEEAADWESQAAWPEDW